MYYKVFYKRTSRLLKWIDKYSSLCVDVLYIYLAFLSNADEYYFETPYTDDEDDYYVSSTDASYRSRNGNGLL